MSGARVLLLGSMVAACLGAVGCGNPERDGLPRGRVTIQGQSVAVEIAETPEARRRGLSGRASLATDSGLLFLHPERDRHTYWMKDMEIAIDMVWIDGDRIIGVTHRALPSPPAATDADRKHYTGPAPYDRVLELPAGYALAHGFAAGQRVRFERDAPSD